MKNNRTKFIVSAIFETMIMINQKTYEAKIRRYERMIERAKAIKDRRSEIVSMVSSMLGIVQSFSSINEEQCAGPKCKSAKKPDPKSKTAQSRKNNSK